jgi:hypothetical protein
VADHGHFQTNKSCAWIQCVLLNKGYLNILKKVIAGSASVFEQVTYSAIYYIKEKYDGFLSPKDKDIK